MSGDPREDRHSSRLEKGDQRKAAQRDRDRLLYSNEFRRLAGVTQVVSAEEGHVFHNRLTHTIKVAQIGRRLAEFITEQAAGDRTTAEHVTRERGLNSDVTEAACLAHDIGHPPFGHAAEEELDQVAVSSGLTDGFEGNAQSFRVVTHLSLRTSAEPGLNLSRATLAAILKYPWKRGENSAYLRKWGCYSEESDVYAWARSGASSQRKTLEAAIMDWSDDVAYSVHDIDDFYRAGLVPLDVMLRPTEARETFLKHVAANRTWAGASQAADWGAEFFDQLNVHPSLTAPFRGTVAQYAGLHELTSSHIRRYLGVELPGTVRVARSSAESPLYVAPEIEREVRLLKELMRYYVFEDPVLGAQQRGQRDVVAKLFEVFRKATLETNELQHLIPHRFRPAAETVREAGDSRAAARLSCDIVSSLTERQALDLHSRLTGNVAASVFDKNAR